ncbi:MAG: dephospho-CoA kinase, partial [Chloroflexota bacterium]|nr:dephospho-CoA kinase [Chloroflexota bacterium]
MNQIEAAIGGGPAQGGDPAIIGLTGPIGCGKSTVARMLGELGGSVIDADALARDVTAPGQPALAAIRARFGEAVFEPSGVLDRTAL